MIKLRQSSKGTLLLIHTVHNAWHCLSTNGLHFETVQMAIKVFLYSLVQFFASSLNDDGGDDDIPLSIYVQSEEILGQVNKGDFCLIGRDNVKRAHA